MKAIEQSFPVVQFKCIMLNKAVLNCESVNLYSFIDVFQVVFFLHKAHRKTTCFLRYDIKSMNDEK